MLIFCCVSFLASWLALIFLVLYLYSFGVLQVRQSRFSNLFTLVVPYPIYANSKGLYQCSSVGRTYVAPNYINAQNVTPACRLISRMQFGHVHSFFKFCFHQNNSIPIHKLCHQWLHVVDLVACMLLFALLSGLMDEQTLER